MNPRRRRQQEALYKKIRTSTPEETEIVLTEVIEFVPDEQVLIDEQKALETEQRRLENEASEQGVEFEIMVGEEPEDGMELDIVVGDEPTKVEQ